MAHRGIGSAVVLVLALGACGGESTPVVHPVVIGGAEPPGPGPAVEEYGEPPAVNANRLRDLAELVRDGRRGSREPRSRGLLIVEIQSLEALFSSTPSSSRDRPKLMLRLAEAYVELEASAVRDAQAGSPDDAAKTADLRTSAQRSAIRYYALSKATQNCADPTHDPHHPKGCPDEVLYWLGFEYERSSQLDEARKTYLELIQNWPQSRFVPLAYLAFGEIFYAEGQQHDASKLPLAEQSYREVLKYPPPDNRAWGYAQYKLGLVYRAKGDAEQQAAAFRKATDFTSAYSTLPGSAELAAAVRDTGAGR